MGEKILALDAASGACSACVFENGQVLSFVLINEGLTHSQTLLPAVERVLSEAKTSVRDLDVIAVTIGPGSFTGLKIGAATAKGLAFPDEIPCVALSSLLPLAYSLREKNGIVCAVLDARRNLFYNALFRCEKGTVTRLCPDRQIAAADLLSELNRYDEPVFLAGDGSSLLLKLSGETDRFCFDPADADIRADMAALAVFSGEGTRLPAERLVPAYLRLPQAERERLEREKQKESTLP